MAVGLSPYSTGGENYIEKVTGSFDGKQFGDLHEDNDDIFALIVLKNAGYAQDDKMLLSDVNFILSAQREDGSWDGSVDMTGAAIEALSPFNEDEQVKNALSKAKEFLKKNQKDTGGWENASSTAWALEGILGLGEKIEDWKNNENIAQNYLGAVQDTDGGIKGEDINSRIWQTAYVLSALSGKTWNQLMQKYEKVEATGDVLGAQTEIKVNIPTPAKKAFTKTKPAELAKIAPSTATAITPVENTAPQPEPKKENWFIRFLKFIF